MWQISAASIMPVINTIETFFERTVQHAVEEIFSLVSRFVNE